MKQRFVGKRVRVLEQGSYREVWLARPAARNALDLQMRDELYSALVEILDDPEARQVGLLGKIGLLRQRRPERVRAAPRPGRSLAGPAFALTPFALFRYRAAHGRGQTRLCRCGGD